MPSANEDKRPDLVRRHDAGANHARPNKGRRVAGVVEVALGEATQHNPAGEVQGRLNENVDKFC